MKKLMIVALMTLCGVTTLLAQKTVVSQKAQQEDPFTVVEQMPEFPGGMEGMMTFMKDNMKYPEDAEKQKVEGRVLVQFIVEKDGSLSNVKVLRSVFPSLDAEAVRVVKAMPKWKAVRQKGEPVRVKYTIPIMFKLK